MIFQTEDDLSAEQIAEQAYEAQVNHDASMELAKFEQTLHTAHVEEFHNAMAEQYSDMAEVHRDYLGYVYTQAEYLEIESKCHPALFCSAQRPLTELPF